MKKQLHALVGAALILSLTACGNKKGTVGPDGSSEPAPTPGQETVTPGQTQNGGVVDGPTPIDEPATPPRIGQQNRPPKKEVAPPRTENGNGRGQNRNDSDDGAILPPVVSGQDQDDSNDIVPPRRRNEAPVVVEPRREREQTLPTETWFPPKVDGSPARAWLEYTIDPVVKRLTRQAPQAQSMSTRMKVTIALGYFDGYHDGAFVYDGENYGRHAAADPFLRAAMEDVLTRACDGNLQICGFEMVSGNDVETLYRREGEGQIIQDVRILSGAYSVMHEENTQSAAAQQKSRSQRAERLFLKSFSDSNLVIYIGHSRKGGGPDFNPPRLLKNGTVNYAAYQKERTGAKNLVRAVGTQGRKATSLALLSCDTSDHFLSEVRSAGRQIELATTTGDMLAADQAAIGLATLDLFLRQGHLKGLRSFLSSTPKLSKSLEVLSSGRAAGR